MENTYLLNELVTVHGMALYYSKMVPDIQSNAKLRKLIKFTSDGTRGTLICFRSYCLREQVAALTLSFSFLFYPLLFNFEGFVWRCLEMFGRESDLFDQIWYGLK